MTGFKHWVKKGLQRWQQRQYSRLLEEKTVTYDSWIKAAEAGKYGEGGAEREISVRRVPYGVSRDYLTKGAADADTAEVALFVGEDGTLSEIAEKAAADFFGKNPGIAVAYGDEDVKGPDGIRYTPWLKPHWSPDTFLSFFYFGNVFAVRTKALRALTEEETKWIWERGQAWEGGFGNRGLYRLCYVLAAKSGGFSVRDGAADLGKGQGPGFPVGHMDEILFHARNNLELEFARSIPLDATGCPVKTERGSGTGQAEEKGLLSVIIPSKENPATLKRCIKAVQQQCKGIRGNLGWEILVVDNGSSEGVKKELEAWLAENGCRYLYRKMPFHFSKMCNLGAEAAKGDALLFLNDDVEMARTEAGEACSGQECLPERLYARAKRGFTGAVGTKLYYPASRRIQHAGIVNLRPGPVHKLQFKEDGTDYFYGWNRRERNVVAVTGACLAVERKKFEEAGGFPEALPVAFNDVDFCFTLHEKGYYNVVLQDAELYHYESMSRGDDDNREKLGRLLGEKDRLYERHPHMYGEDPFYHKYLCRDILSTGFDLEADYQGNAQRMEGRIKAGGLLDAHAREDACVIVSLEYAGSSGPAAGMEETAGVRAPGLAGKRNAGGEETGAKEGAGIGRGYLLQGYAFVAGSDNACFEKYLIFDREETKGAGPGRAGADADGCPAAEKVWSLKAEPCIRRDVEGNLPDQVNVGMTGFHVQIGADSLPAGAYRVGVLARDKCSGQKLYAWTNRYLTVF